MTDTSAWRGDRPAALTPDETTEEGELLVGSPGTVTRAWNDISPKVTFGALGAAVATIATYAIEQLTGIDLPVTVEGAAVVVFTFAAGYLVPDTH